MKSLTLELSVSTGFAVLGFLLSSPALHGQILGVRLGPQRACIDDNGDFEVSFEVDHVLRNAFNSPMVISRFVDTREIYDLFRSTTDRSSPVYGYNPDYVAPPNSLTRSIAPHQAITWKTDLVVSISGHKGGIVGLPEPGTYFAAVVPNVQIVRPKRTQVSLTDRFVPLTIAPPSAQTESCSRR